MTILSEKLIITFLVKYYRKALFASYLGLIPVLGP